MIYEPHLIKGEGEQRSATPLSQCDQKMCDELMDQLVERRGQAMMLGKAHLVNQIDGWINQVRMRQSDYDAGVIQDKPKPQKGKYEGLKLMDDD